MIYGTPGIRIDLDITDIVGLRNLVLSQLWEPKQWPVEPLELRRLLCSTHLAYLPPAPEWSDAIEQESRQTRAAEGGPETDATQPPPQPTRSGQTS